MIEPVEMGVGGLFLVLGLGLGLGRGAGLTKKRLLLVVVRVVTVVDWVVEAVDVRVLV
jgi:hypothetical protein